MTGFFASMRDLSRALIATVWYLVVAVALTWPLARGLTSDFPSDFGDPVFVSWVIARAGDHWLALLSGDVSALTRFWNAEMFYPETLSTAFSEHFAAHALQVLPVWATTRNIVLCYNLLFLSTYVLSGLGMYLLVRDLTGHPRAAFVAGLAFMCAPYRVTSMPHLQVLSSQWMPFSFLGLRRYLASGSRSWLAGGAAAIWLQNLSSGYYLIYFAPFVALYAIAEMAARSMLRRWRVWRDLAVAGVAALLLTLPFAIPYVLLKNRFQYRRPLDQIEPFSADVLAWVTSDPRLNVWGGLQTWFAVEGLLFTGLTVVLVAVLGAGTAVLRPRDVSQQADGTARAVGIFALAGIAIAVWLALGPTPKMAGQPLPIPSLFRVLYEIVPGFDVSRAPARFAMIVVLLLAVLAGYGVAWLSRTRARFTVPVLAVAIVLEGAAWPFPVNGVFWISPEVTRPEAKVHPEASAPRIWRYLGTLPRDAVVAHLPFGYAEYEIRYLFYSNVGPHHTINGYSGNFPPSYVSRLSVLQRPLLNPDAALARLHADGVTHVVVHADAWPDDTGFRVHAWLERSGAMRLARFDDATVYALSASVNSALTSPTLSRLTFPAATIFP